MSGGGGAAGGWKNRWKWMVVFVLIFFHGDVIIILWEFMGIYYYDIY